MNQRFLLATVKVCLFLAGFCVGTGRIAVASGSNTFSVTSPGFYYSINGQSPNPPLTLTRGMTYTFAVATSAVHPFEIVSSTIGTPYTNGVMNNNISSGSIKFTVPAGAPDTLRYICSIHFFGGAIQVVNPVPPSVKVVGISLTKTNVTLRSTGTNGWKAIPEFNSNLITRSWASVPNYTNLFVLGTNVTTFNRLEAICGPDVFLRIRATNN